MPEQDAALVIRKMARARVGDRDVIVNDAERDAPDPRVARGARRNDRNDRRGRPARDARQGRERGRRGGGDDNDAQNDADSTDWRQFFKH